jgi:macrolide-specific efflux system membrane fusion protein
VILMSSSERAAMLDAARAMGEKEYKRWKTIYKESPIVAPMNGFVILRSKEPGQTVSASDVVLVMADDLVIDANVDETDLKYMRIGQELIMSLDAFPDEKFGGIVEHIAYEATVVSNVTVYTVRIRPINKPKIFRSGMTATITVEIENKTGVLALPVEFINTVGDRNSVMVVAGKKDADKPRKSKGNFEVRQVELGLSDGRWTEIVSGLTEDDVVVILGMAKAKNAKSGGGMMGGQRVGR